MGDLKSKRWIVAKGVMFLAIAVLSGGLILAEKPSWRLAALLATLVWAACRFYYFLFYVLERYVDPTMRYAGVCDLLQGMRQRRLQQRVASPLDASQPTHGTVPAAASAEDTGG